MYEQICTWDNLNLAWRKAARGKRGRATDVSRTQSKHVHLRLR